MLDIPPAPAHVLATNDSRNVDRWQKIEFTPPGYVWLAVGSAVAGTGIREGRRDGVLLDRHSLHLITPETDRSAHYFWVMTHDAAQVDRSQESILYEQSLKAFNEDLAIIEGQQQRLDPGRPTIDVNADAGVLQVRRVFDRLLATQRAA
jgi:vanillate O-demethylase monooxygenase subunit